jgi:hypothetical protein
LALAVIRPFARTPERAPEHDCGLTVFQHACLLGCEGIVSKRLGSATVRPLAGLAKFRTGCSAVKREAEEDWGDGGIRAGPRSSALGLRQTAKGPESEGDGDLPHRHLLLFIESNEIGRDGT